MIDILSVLLGYLLGTFLTGALCVFVLGWTSGNMDRIDYMEQHLKELREKAYQDARSDRSEHL